MAIVSLLLGGSVTLSESCRDAAAAEIGEIADHRAEPAAALLLLTKWCTRGGSRRNPHRGGGLDLLETDRFLGCLDSVAVDARATAAGAQRKERAPTGMKDPARQARAPPTT